MPAVEPLTCSSIPGTVKITENMMIVAKSAISVSRKTIVPAALTSTISLLEVVVSYFIDERDMPRPKATLMSGGAIFVFTVLSALSFGAISGLSTFELFEGKVGVFSTLDHFASNWALPLGGLLITLGAGWFMTRSATEGELMDDATPGWFSYGAWRFFMRFVAPVAVAAILVAVIFFGADFS